MSISKYISDVKTANQNNETIYNFLSDFNNLGKMLNDTVLQQIAQQMPNTKIESFETDTDHCRFVVSPHGPAGFEIADREPPKTIKITGSEGMPMEIFLWIQILPVSAYQSKLRVTLHVQLNMMMKMMAGKKIKDGIDKLADLLAMFPYTAV